MDSLTTKGHELVDQAAIWGAKMKENVIDDSHLQYEGAESNLRSDGLASLTQRRRGWTKKGSIGIGRKAI